MAAAIRPSAGASIPRLLTCGRSLSEGELYFIIENGVRLTGMPAWGPGGDDDLDSWKLVAFIRHLPGLTRQEETEMEKINPKGPQNRQEGKEEEDFLKGRETAPSSDHHPHQH
jgi:hypothetical protein